MGKVQQFLTGLERNKEKIAKFFITCAVLKFFSSTLYRIYSIQNSRTQIESTINVYSLFIVGFVFFHEFLKCLLCKAFTDNLKLLTHYKGKGIAFILISFIYMSQSMGNQQNYSAYLLFFVGIILLFVDCKFESEGEKKSPYELALERTKSKQQRESVEFEPIENHPSYAPTNGTDSSREIHTSIEIPKKESTNPYDIPEDF